MTHDWHRPLLAAPRDKPMVHGWITCSTCGAQVTKAGALVFRASARDEWTTTEPPCAPSVRGER